MKKSLIKQSKTTQYPKYDGEIDFFLILENLWDYKLKILAISFLACVMGVFFYMTTPKLNILELKISPAKKFVFSEYYKINQLFKSVDLNTSTSTNTNASTDTNTKIEINNTQVFELFVQELSDYDEIFSVISSLDIIEENTLNNLDENKKTNLINSYINKIKISKPTENVDEYTLSIEWNDLEQAKDIILTIVYSSLENTKHGIYDQFENYANTLELKINNQIASLESKIESVFEIQKLIEKKRLDYLYEQSVIARSLGINTIDFKGISFSLIDLNQDQNRTTNLNGFPDYLYGYEALEKEIELILGRSSLNTLLTSEDYVLLERDIATLKSNIFTKQLRNEINFIKNDNVDDWISFNINLINVTPSYLPMYQIIFISFIAGLFFSSFYFLIYRSFQDRKIKDN